MIKLIACDLDGTLLQNGAQDLRPETAGLIKELTAQGRIFVPASGRQYPNLQRLFAPVKEEIGYICENGSLVIYQGEILDRHEIPRELGQDILKHILEKETAEALLSGVHTCYIQPKTEEYLIHVRDVVKNHVTVVEDLLQVEEPYLKISVYEKDGVESSQKFWEERYADQVTVVTSGMAWLDTIPKGVHKGTALQVLSGHLGIRPEEIMAFGDHYNDVEMLKSVPNSVAMKNAQPGIRELCRYESALVEDTLREILEGKYD